MCVLVRIFATIKIVLLLDRQKLKDLIGISVFVYLDKWGDEVECPWFLLSTC